MIFVYVPLRRLKQSMLNAWIDNLLKALNLDPLISTDLSTAFKSLMNGGVLTVMINLRMSWQWWIILHELFLLRRRSSPKVRVFTLQRSQIFTNILKVCMILAILYPLSVRQQELWNKNSLKNTQISFPSYLTDRYTFALLFHTSKFPPLPSSEFSLGFWPSFPRWFVCGYLQVVIQNECKKSVERLVAIKYDIYSFPGHLHVVIQNVEILCHIHTSDTSKEFWNLLIFSLHFCWFCCRILL